MNRIKKVLVMLIESLLIGYIFFSIFSPLYDGYRRISKDIYYYPKDLTLSREIIVSLDDGNELTLKQGDVIHSCALNKDGNIIDAYYKISDGNCLYIKSTLEANCFIEKDELSSDFQELIIRKANDLSNARKTAVMAFTVIFIISFFISLAIMIVSKGNTKFHIVFIVVLGIISLLLLFVYGIS